MPALDFTTVVTLGAAIAALLTVVFALLIPTLGESRATRSVSMGNLFFTLMLATRVALGDPPTPLGYAAAWSMLVVASAKHRDAIEELAGDAAPGLRRGLLLVGFLSALWFALWALPTPQVGGAIAGAASFVAYVGAASAAGRLPGAHLRIARRWLVAVFGASALFAALHVVVRLTEFASGTPTVSAAAATWFGGVLIFCAINVAVLLLLYLRLADRVNRLAQTDDLTGALNRRGLAERLALLRAMPARPGRGALLLIDIDRFKNVNDEHGHAVGDEVLRWFAQTLRRFMRHDDLLARMGGEEFCLLLPDVDDSQALLVAERIRVAFEQDCVAPTSVGALRVTASFGLAGFDPGDTALDTRLRQADEALYAAKRSGRNRVVRWAPEVTQPAAL